MTADQPLVADLSGTLLRTALTPDLANLEVHYILINQGENLWLTMAA
jgi:hypothetical protein